MKKYKNAWTQEEDAYLIEHWEKFNDKELGEKLGRTLKAVYARRHKLGLIGRPGKRQKDWSERELEYLRDNWGERTIPEIAKSLGRGVNAVKTKSVRIGLIGQVKYGEIVGT